MPSHNEVIDNYFNSSSRTTYNKGNNVFFEGDKLYSYGYHFILAQKCMNGYIINGDGYSISTTKHQSITRRHVSGYNYVTVPFSAIEAFFRSIKQQGTDINEFNIIDKTKDFYTQVKYTDKDGTIKERDIHHLGASLIKYKKHYLLLVFTSQYCQLYPISSIIQKNAFQSTPNGTQNRL